MLEIIIFTILISTLLNLLLRRFEIPTIIGYIATGTLISYGFGLNDAANNHELKEIAEFGVVFLMFTIGLEFSLKQLVKMKKEVFVYGGAQVLISALLFMSLAMWIFNIEVKSAIIIGLALALSSTAIVLKLLNESGDINRLYGRKVLGVLLFQDIAVIPILLMITIFSMNDKSISSLLLETVINATILMIGLFLTGKYLLEPFLDEVRKAKSNEIFISSILLIVMGSAYLAHMFGFSYSLGAFIAGMMIAETHYKYQVEADLIPFRDLLLGVFFITVGMQLNFSIIFEYIFWISLLLPALMLLKILIVFTLLRFENTKRVSFKSALTLLQLGEFALVIFELSFARDLLDPVTGQVLIVIVVLSMILTPFIFKNISRLTDIFMSSSSVNMENSMVNNSFLVDHVVLIGYGKLGKNIAKFLKKRDVKFIAIDFDVPTVMEAQAKREPVIFGNAAQKSILKSVNIREASAVIVSISNHRKLNLLCETLNDVTNNSKTIVKVDNYDEKEALSGLNLSHIVVENEETAMAMVEEAMKESNED